ncbi:unnamed protein product [Candidula unifasciata]|uniref:Uncharacterized protein n=1 Tax=Candidula unifasciata TaxID=100452 RepID=A0A8S3YGE0_9EUPU|nr:unnamed protein product [Candidula unifasciata]
MSVSQYDDLLGEFADSTVSGTAKTNTIGAFDEDYDPFGPSPGAVQSTNLLDDSARGEIENGYASNGVDLDLETNQSLDSADYFHDMSARNQSSYSPNEPGSGSVNLLDDVDSTQSSNPVYDFGAEATSGSEPADNLFDVDNVGATERAAEEVDFLSGANVQQHEDVDLLQTSQPSSGDADLLGDFEVVHREEAVEQKYEPETAEDQLDQPEDLEAEEEQQQYVEEYQEQEEIAEEDKFEEVGREDVASARVIPAVEVTESPDQGDSQQEESLVGEISKEYISEVEAKEEAEVEEEDVEENVEEEHEDEVSAVREDFTEDVEPPSILTTDTDQDSLVVDSLDHDRREKDLEHYCMDREESDLMEDIETEHHVDSLKPREQRSRSPSRSIGPDIPEDIERRQPSPTPDTDTAEDVDTLRPREERSQAPSRSPEPVEQDEDEHAAADSGLSSRAAVNENRNAGLDDQPTQEYVPDRRAEEGSLSTERAAAAARDTTSYPEPTQASQASSGASRSQAEEEEEEEEGIYENQPAQRDDVVREADTDRTADLPATGTAHNLREKFILAQQEAAAPSRSTREITPPSHAVGGEYVSEPRGHFDKYEGKPESGIFESQPVVKTDVITSTTPQEEAKYTSGHAKSTAAKFKEIENQTYTPSGKRELTPDRSGQVEYVSEPKAQFEVYEGKAESGVFESEPVVNPDVIRAGEEVQEKLPERGTAKNLAEKFLQISAETASSPVSPRGKREITPDRSGRVEYVSEPRGAHTEDYEVKVDAGVFENQPQRNLDVITSDTVAEDAVPERGYAKNVAAKFKELEITVKSPSLSPGRRKEFTPPREDERFHLSGVVENTPDFKSDVIHADDHLEDARPERGTAKNMAQRFRQLETESKTPGSFRAKKEFTPPPGDTGVYENQPKQFQADYNKPPESGIIENQPLKRDDVVRGDEPPKFEEELPERGAAKNLVNKWKQLETEGTKVKSPGSGRPKEFTPPREEPRIAEQRKSPRTPLSPSGNEQLDNGSVHPSDLPGQYQPQNEPSVFESTPEQRSDVLREGDTDWAKGMPKKDQAKKMLARFQNLQAEANKQPSGPAPRKAKDVRNQ